jgi:D-erythronate 2-dehydrogenase
VRPGKPNAATSSFVSSIIREPLQKLRTTCPVNADTAVWVLSSKTVIDHFIHAAGLSSNKIQSNRIFNLPGTTLTVQEMVTALDEVAGFQASDWIDWIPDAFIQSIVLTWPPHFNVSKAIDYGFQRDMPIGEIIKNFIKSELKGIS